MKNTSSLQDSLKLLIQSFPGIKIAGLFIPDSFRIKYLISLLSIIIHEKHKVLLIP
jgi:hypothetical protein